MVIDDVHILCWPLARVGTLNDVRSSVSDTKAFFFFDDKQLLVLRVFRECSRVMVVLLSHI